MKIKTGETKNKVFFVKEESIPKIEMTYKGNYAGGKMRVLITEEDKLPFETRIKLIS